MILPSWNTFRISMGNFRWKLGKSCAWFCNARFSYSLLTFYSMQVWEVDSNNEFTTCYPYFVLQDNLCKSWKMQRSDALSTIFSHLLNRKHVTYDQAFSSKWVHDYSQYTFRIRHNLKWKPPKIWNLTCNF